VIEFDIADAAAMEALGARFAPLLGAGDLLLLDGELGAGKTTFTRGLGAALGARGAITSPTFVLAREHPTAAGPHLVHVDAYRLATAAEVEDLDLDWDGAIVVVEWSAGKVDVAAASHVRVAIERPIGGDPLAEDAPRTVRIEGVGRRWALLDDELKP
jgi:tRNA threonylcarbamoyladenosine biosynthesis protein TsaE